MEAEATHYYAPEDHEGGECLSCNEGFAEIVMDLAEGGDGQPVGEALRFDLKELERVPNIAIYFMIALPSRPHEKAAFFIRPAELERLILSTYGPADDA